MHEILLDDNFTVEVFVFLHGKWELPGSNGNRTNFYDCPISGTESNGVRTNLEEINALFDRETNKRDFFWLLDEFHFDVVRISHGKHELAFRI